MDAEKKLLGAGIIRSECGENVYWRGKSYFDKGQVQDFSITSEGTLFVQLYARVIGTDPVAYRQNIRVVWRPDLSNAEIDGECSCPVGYNCKHVVAVCLEYQRRALNLPVASAPDCLDWLAGFVEPSPELHNPQQDFIAYFLKPGKTAQQVVVDLVVTRAKKTGGLNKGRSTTLANLRYSYAYLNYIQPQDQEIARLLLSLETHTGLPILAGTAGYLVLAKLLPTGRLYWMDGQQPALKKGHNRDLAMSWQQLPEGDYRLNIQLDPQTRVILTDPPQYLDVETSTLGGLNGGLTARQLEKVLSAPVIPAAIADEFSEKLTFQFPELSLPAPKKIEVQELLDLTPVPNLKLSGIQQGKDYRHQIILSFDYGDYHLSAIKPGGFGMVRIGQTVVKIKRQMEIEQLAIDRLNAFGFVIVEDPNLQELNFINPEGKTALSGAVRWGDFLQRKLPELANEGWRYEIADSFLLDFQAADNWEAEIEESQNDWFEMRFNIDIGGQAYALLPLIMPVLENYDPDDLPEMLSIPLGNHRYLSVAGEKLKPVLKVLYELFDRSNFADDGALRLSRFNVVTLADLEEHHYGVFSLRGGKALRELAQQIKNFAGIAEVALPNNLKAELRPYQRHGLNWLQFLRGYQFAGILADDMGLGKTVQTLSHLLLEKQQGRLDKPCLIIAPTSLMSNWRREAERFTPDLTVLTLQGTERKQLFDHINAYDLVLTTYPLLPRDEESLREHHYYYLILDEAQTIKNPLAKAAQIVRQIKADHRLCLTGTPMENHLGELWAQFDFLMPGFLGDSQTFKKHYRTPIEIHGDNQQRQRLTRRIAPFMLRRTKHDVATELPAKTEIIRSVPLYPKQAALYESIRLTMERKVREAIAEKGLARSHIAILDALLKLRQTCCDPRTLALKEAQKITESAKLDLLMEMLPEQLEEGRRILLFSQFTRMIALIEIELAKRKIEYAKLTGQTKKRDEAIEQFKSGAANIFLISLKAGGVGLNLTEADTVIIYDPWWNPAAENQAADRAHRIGQHKPVFVYKLITENTVEEKIIALQDKKRALAEGIYKDGDKEASLKLTADDLTALFEPL